MSQGAVIAIVFILILVVVGGGIGAYVYLKDRCTTDVDCAPTGWCNIATSKCVAKCSATNKCSTGLVCDGAGKCVKSTGTTPPETDCDSDGDCDPDEECNSSGMCKTVDSTATSEYEGMVIRRTSTWDTALVEDGKTRYYNGPSWESHGSPPPTMVPDDVYDALPVGTPMGLKDGGSSCTLGEENCQCDNGACDAGVTCIGGMCVKETTGSGSGTNGSACTVHEDCAINHKCFNGTCNSQPQTSLPSYINGGGGVKGVDWDYCEGLSNMCVDGDWYSIKTIDGKREARGPYTRCAAAQSTWGVDDKPWCAIKAPLTSNFDHVNYQTDDYHVWGVMNCDTKHVKDAVVKWNNAKPLNSNTVVTSAITDGLSCKMTYNYDVSGGGSATTTNTLVIVDSPMGLDPIIVVPTS